MNFSQFLSLDYWFEVSPAGDFQYLRLLTWITIGVFALAIILQLWARFGYMNGVVRRFLRRLPGPMYITGILSGFLLFARNQRAPYISMRFILALVFFFFALWFVTVFVKFVSHYKQDLGAYIKRKENKKMKKRLK